MRRVGSWTGLALAAAYGLVFVALYLDYQRRAGTWFADLPLVLAALPFTLTMRALNGGSYDFAGDMTARVVAAGLFGSALAYIAGFASRRLCAPLIGAVRSHRTGSLTRPRRAPKRVRKDSRLSTGYGTRPPIRRKDARGSPRQRLVPRPCPGVAQKMGEWP